MTFANFIDGQQATCLELPLTHTSEYSRLVSIKASHTLDPQPCQVFGQPVLYLFYGRPSFRDVTANSPQQDLALCPICFVFKPGTLSKNIRRLYPFDTGASQRDMYEDLIPAKDALQNYVLSSVIESACKLVHFFFESNERYFRGIPRNAVSVAGLEELQKLHQLFRGGGKKECDDRRSAIEVQISAQADLRQNLLAVALPNHFLDDSNLKKILMYDWCAEPLPYSADPGMRPTEFHGVIRELIRELYKKWEFI